MPKQICNRNIKIKKKLQSLGIITNLPKKHTIKRLNESPEAPDRYNGKHGSG